MGENPIPLEYRTPPLRPPVNRQGFFQGLALGAVVSLVTWSLAVLSSNLAVLISVLIAIPVIKVSIGAMLMWTAKRRYFGLGLLISIPLGGLIAFGLCATGLR